jgi:hypothetical protein
VRVGELGGDDGVVHPRPGLVEVDGAGHGERDQVGGGRVGVQDRRRSASSCRGGELGRVGGVEDHRGVLVAELDGAQRVVGVPDRVAGGLDVHGELGGQPNAARISRTSSSWTRRTAPSRVTTAGS